ncbi:MAG: nucleoside permease [Woeseiaceae bacterium]|nr:nucleoside permease [Woeseiaceae bacterium]
MKRKLSIMMFIEYFIWGAWFVPLWQYLDKLGFSATQIAWSYSCTGIAAIVSPVLVGVIADRYFSAEKVLAFLHAAGAMVLLAITQQTEFSSFIPLLLLYALIYMPTLAITNSIAFINLKDTERDFPRVRVLGTIGWIFSGIVVGFVPTMLGFDDISTTNIPFVVTAVASILLAVYALVLPETPPQRSGGAIDLKELLGLNALGMLKDKTFAMFSLCSFLFCIPLAFYYQFANGYLTQVGLQNATGWMSLGQVAEIVFMVSLAFFLKRFGIKKVLLLGLVTAAFRYGFFMIGGTENLWVYALLFGGILLHGASYDFYFVTAFIYTDRKAPAHMRSAAQGLLTLVCMGLGSVIGNQVGGQVLEHFALDDVVGTETFDWFAVWGVGAGIIIAVMLLFVLAFRGSEALEQEARA